MADHSLRPEAAHPATRALRRFAPLRPEEERALADAWTGTRTLRPGEVLVREGDCPAACSLVLDGLLCRHKLLPGEERQIVSFVVPGDLCEADGLLADRMDYDLAALTETRLAILPRAGFDALLAGHPGIARAIWRATAADAAIAREWVANVGRRQAYQRIAHLLCELATRLRAAGPLQGAAEAERQAAMSTAMPVPPTTQDLADATGLSAVHVNRALQQFGADGLIARKDGGITVLDPAGLRQAGEFSPDYLGQYAATV